MGKAKIKAEIVRQDNIATDIFSMVISAGSIAKNVVPGQFVD